MSSASNTYKKNCNYFPSSLLAYLIKHDEVRAEPPTLANEFEKREHDDDVVALSLASGSFSEIFVQFEISIESDSEPIVRAYDVRILCQDSIEVLFK
jgi:hypothetical protein